MLPTVELPAVIPLTCHVTEESVALSTVALNCRVPATSTAGEIEAAREAGVVGVVVVTVDAVAGAPPPQATAIAVSNTIVARHMLGLPVGSARISSKRMARHCRNRRVYLRIS